ncbi:MAG: anti-sigma factor family protein [Phycisphaerae bacterium]
MNPQDHDEYLLSQYLDDQLEQADRADLEDRLNQDPALANLLDQLRRTDRWVRAAAEPAPRIDWDRFADQVAHRCQAHDTARRRQRILRLYVPLAAAAAIAIVTTLTLTFQSTNRVAQGPPSIDTGLTTPDDATAAPGRTLMAGVHVSLVRPTGLEITRAAPDQPNRSALALAAAGAFVQADQAPETTPYF